MAFQLAFPKKFFVSSFRRKKTLPSISALGQVMGMDEAPLQEEHGEMFFDHNWGIIFPDNRKHCLSKKLEECLKRFELNFGMEL